MADISSRSSCFAFCDPKDAECKECKATQECQIATEISKEKLEGKQYGDMNAQEKTYVEDALDEMKNNSGKPKGRRKAQADTKPKETKEKPPTEKPDKDDDLENQLDAEIAAMDGSDTSAAPSEKKEVAQVPPPKEEETETAPAPKKRRGRKPKSAVVKEAIETEEKTTEKAAEVLDEADKTILKDKEPVEIVKTEGLINNLMRNNFSIIFDPLVQKLIPEALGDKIILHASKDMLGVCLSLPSSIPVGLREVVVFKQINESSISMHNIPKMNKIIIDETNVESLKVDLLNAIKDTMELVISMHREDVDAVKGVKKTKKTKKKVKAKKVVEPTKEPAKKRGPKPGSKKKGGKKRGRKKSK